MNRRRLSLASAAALLAVAGCGESSKKQAPPPAAPPAAAPAHRDAAERYQAAWESWPASWMTGLAFLLNDSATPKMDTSEMARSAGVPAWSDLAQSLRAHQSEVKDLMAIAAEPTCDFKLSASSDDAKEMQIGGNVRAAWRLLRADAGRCWQAGDMDGCVDRLVAGLGLVDHAGQQKLVMMSLSGGAVAGVACQAVQAFIKESPAGAFKPEHAERLLRAMARVDAADPAGIDAALKAEGTVDPAVTANVGPAKERIRSAWAEAKALLTERAKR